MRWVLLSGVLLAMDLVGAGCGLDSSSPSRGARELPVVIWAATFREGLCLSTSGGIGWVPVPGDWSAVSGYQKTVVMPSGSRLYVATTGAGVFRVGAGEAVLEAVNEGLTNLEVRSLASSPYEAGPLLAGTRGGGVFRREEEWEEWRWSSDGLSCYNVTSIAFDDHDPQRVYCATYGGLFISSDQGLSWTPAWVGIENPDLRCVVADPGRANQIWVGAGAAGRAPVCFRSDDGGASYRRADKGLRGRSVLCLLATGGQEAAVYAGTSRGVFYRDGGMSSWRVFGRETPSAAINSLAYDPHSHALFAASSQGVHRCLGPQEAWMLLDEGLPPTSISSLLVAGGLNSSR